MRTLFSMDKKDYKEGGKTFSRPSVRAVIVRDDTLAMVYSQKYDYYKFPGGGINKGESRLDALIREVREETGLIVDPDTVREYGLVIRKQKGIKEDIFIQENYYYLCSVKDYLAERLLDDYEQAEGFTLEWVTPSKVIDINKSHNHFGCDMPEMIERDTKVTKMLVKEYF